MGCRRKNTLCLSLDFGAKDGTLLPRLTRLETSPSPQKRLVLKFSIGAGVAQDCTTRCNSERLRLDIAMNEIVLLIQVLHSQPFIN